MPTNTRAEQRSSLVQPLDFCVQHLALNFFSLLFKIGEKAFFFFPLFFFTCEVNTLIFYFFIMSQIGSTLRSTLFGLVMKCTNVQSY